MRFIRRLLFCLALAFAVTAILALLSFVPAVQTMVAERMFPDQPGRKLSLGSLSAGLSGAEITDMSLEVNGAVLTLPSLRAGFPLKTAVWDRQVVVRTLVAKGWTLDFTHRLTSTAPEAHAPAAAERTGEPGETAPPGNGSPALQAVRVIRGILREWKFPYDGSLDGVELEGDVLLAAASERDPLRVHVILKGGGLAADHAGDFSVEAEGAVADPSLPFDAASTRGHLVVALGPSRKISRLEFKGSLAAKGGALPENLAVAVGAALPDGPGDETYTVDFSQGARHLATFGVGLPQATHRLEGTWKVDLRETDWAPFFTKRSWPSIAANGEGRFDADPAFAQTHATGGLAVAASRLSALAPQLDRLGSVALDASFTLTRSRHSIQFERLGVNVAGLRPIAVVTALQAFSIDDQTGALKTADMHADWLECSVQGLPLAWLSDQTSGIALAGADATGAFVMRTNDEGFVLSPKGPLIANGVTVRRADRIIGQALDLSLTWRADFSPQGWQVQAAPLTVSSAAQQIATIEAKVGKLAKSDGRIEIVGTWHADVEALAARSVIPGVSEIKGRTASGDFTVRLGTTTEVQGKVNVTGHDPAHILTASAHGYLGARGATSFRVPLKIAFGPKVVEFTVEGRSSVDKNGTRLDVDVTGTKLSLEPVGLLAAVLPVFDGDQSAANLAAATGEPRNPALAARDVSPFWRDLTGRVRFECYELEAGGHHLNDVAAMFEIDRASIRLKDGRGAFALRSTAAPDRLRRFSKTDNMRSQVKAEGVVTFDAVAEVPYSLKATAAVDVVDASRLFPASQPEHEASLEGRFSLAGTLTANGRNLADLIERRQEEYRLAGTSGIIRLLKTNVAVAIPEAPSPVSDTLGTVGSAMGSAVGSIFGLKGKGGYLTSGKTTLSKNTEAVLDFASQITEIGFEQATLSATRGSDHALHLVEIEIKAPTLHLTGSGQIADVKDQPVSAQPLSLELRLGAQGRMAELLSTAGLLAADKDSLGYAMLREPIHLGGTLSHIDESQWRDLLVKAATKAPESGKKGG